MNKPAHYIADVIEISCSDNSLPGSYVLVLLEQLIHFVKYIRRPKFAERLVPSVLSHFFRSGLR